MPPNGFSPVASAQRFQSPQPSYPAYPRSAPGQPPYPPPQVSQYAPAPAPAAYAAQMPPPRQAAPPPRQKGTLTPGQLIRVGEHTVKVERYLSEGGYAHVYLTSSDKPIYPPTVGEAKKGRWGEKGYTEHCLKRIAFEDDSVWAEVSKEIDVMKALPPSQHLIQYLDSTHSRAANGKHEVFILMEFCAGGGIIDFLNKRLRDRLNEMEILNIFTDVCEAVAAMHALPKPLLHRDLKIENVLSHPISSGPSPKRPTPLIFKLCDFGSTTHPASRPPQNKAEADAQALDLNRHTTLQYRSPEMVEPMLGWAVGLPSDVWALGVLLYKLCYYTTPFEEHGTLAIVNAKYTFPQYPVYSPRLQHLIASMLVEHPTRRPSVFEVLNVAHEMSGTRPEVDYGHLPSRSVQPVQQPAPSRTKGSSNLLDFTDSPARDKTPVMQPSLASTVQPQRRGRPTREPSKSSGLNASHQLPPLSISQPSTVHPAPVSRSQPGLMAATSSSGIKLQVTGGAEPVVQAGHRSKLPELQVMGETPEPAKSPSVDAFGMPSSTPAGKSSASSPLGFGDSFGSKTSTGFGDSFAAKPSSTGSRFGATLNSGGESTRPRASSNLSQGSNPKSVPSSPIKLTASTASKPPSPSAQARKTADPASSIPDGELTFEQRFPSIETLSSDDALTPPATQLDRPPLSRQGSVAAPVVRPQSTPRTSFANRTGGDFVSSHLSAPSTSGAPQPRSTQVTGTAFRASFAAPLSSSPLSTLDSPLILKDSQSPSAAGKEPVDYFASTEGDAESASLLPAMSASRSRPKDLISGSGSGGAELNVPALRPTLSTNNTRGPPSTTTKPSGLSARPLPKPPKAAPAAIKTAKLSPPGPADDSSGDEASTPESASGTGRRPASPIRRGSRPTSPRIAQRMSVFAAPPASACAATRSAAASNGFLSPRVPVKAATVANTAPASDSGIRRVSSERRPVSMYTSSTSGSTAALLSPPAGSAPVRTPSPRGLNDGTSLRPTHGRRGSTHDMVSHYEAMRIGATSAAARTSPTKASFALPPATSASQTLGRKPSVASKPAALRKAADPAPVAGTPAQSSSPASPARRTGAPPRVEKPTALAGRARAFGDAPAPTGYSKSSSGRSFPIHRAEPGVDAGLENGAAGSSSSNGAGPRPGPAAAVASGSGSPERQQPVSSLIARWNKGEIAAQNVGDKPKRGGSV
ncbi:Ark- serine/threonine protein kinase [Cryptotrichosporon argae]